ncbi:MAG: apolipoprotein N-acyltransferase [Phycisphaerae bacterium]
MAKEKQGERRAGQAAAKAGRRPLGRARTAYLLAAVSALMLSLAFPPAEISWLAYLALVPLLVMAAGAASRRQVFWAAYLGGFIFFGANLRWVIPITAVGWFALVAYMGLYWAVFAWGARSLGEMFRVPASPRGVPLTLAAPVLWVALEFVRGWLLTGLPWLYVGHTQYENLALIQTADALGVYGPSFLALATAGFIADVLSRPLFVRSGEGSARRLSRAIVAMGVLLVAAWVGTVGYGLWRLGQATTRPGPVVAAIQTSIPQEVKNIARAGGRGEGADDEKPVPIPRQEAERLVEAIIEHRSPNWGGQDLGANVAGLGKKVVADTIEELREELVRRLVEGDSTEDRAEDFAEAVSQELQMLLSQVRLTGEAFPGAPGQESPDLVVWPETMVPTSLNPEFLTADLATLLKYKGLTAHFAFLQERARRYGELIRQVGALGPAPMLVGTSSLEVLGVRCLEGDYVTARTASRNEALLIEPHSPVDVVAGRYAKAHLVPFGEYVPFKDSWPWLYERLHALTPYRGMEYSLTPGAHDQAPMVLSYDGREARFQVAICYEDAFAYRVREMVRPRRAGGAARKAIDFLVNISNDGWFTAKRGEDPWGLAQTAEHRQHLNLCVFRAIENRVPVVRSVNTGVSAVIDSSGRIVAAVTGADPAAGDLSGWLVERLALDQRVAPYTAAGDAFALACVAASAVGAIALAVAWLRKRKEAKL